MLVGEIPPGLPTLAWPSVTLADLAVLAPSAVGIALVGFSDAILTARSLARPDAPAVDTNKELIALAGVNVAAGISQSFPLGSSGSRTAVNLRLGGRTQVVGLVQAGGVALVLLFLTGALALLPKATLGVVSELKDEGIRFVLARSRATFEVQLSKTGHDDVLPPHDRFLTVRAAVSAVTGVDPESPGR